MGELKAPKAIGQRSREGPFAMAKEFAFKEIAGNGAAVHGNEGPARPRALGVHKPRHHFLAGAAFSTNQQGGRGMSDLLNQRPKRGDGGGFPHQRERIV
jgi:hypothetical protein